MLGRRQRIFRCSFSALLVAGLCVDFFMLIGLTLAGFPVSHPMVLVFVLNEAGIILVLWSMNWWQPSSMVHLLKKVVKKVI